jgi:lysophospholipase L1-like esterase
MKKSLAGKLLLVVAFPLVFVTALECALRVAMTGHLYLVESNPHYLDANERMVLRPNAKTWWYGCLYQINSNGFRMSREIGEKQATRILALGDSVTLGMGVVHDRDTWPMILERVAHTGGVRDLDVVNSAAQGWNLLRLDREGRVVPGEFRSFLSDQGAALEPDMIVYCICLNDVPARVDDLFYMDNIRNKQAFRLFPERYREFFKRKAIYRLGRDWYREMRFRDLDFSAISMADDPTIWESAEAELRLLKETAAALGAPLYAVLVPYSFQILPANKDLLRVNEHWHAALSSARIPYVDMVTELNETNVLSYYVLGDYVHMNAKGHELIARRVWEMIRDDSVLAAGTKL